MDLLLVKRYLTQYVVFALGYGEITRTQFVDLPTVSSFGRNTHQMRSAHCRRGFTPINGQRNLYHRHPHIHAVHLGHYPHGMCIALFVKHIFHTHAYHRHALTPRPLCFSLVNIALCKRLRQLRTASEDFIPRRFA